MSPLPIIARQRGLTRIGEIRTGGEKPQRGAGRKLEAFRLTSQHRDIIDRCATLYGGTVSKWASPAGDAWQLYTERAALPVLVIVGYSLQLRYEKWEGATKCVRRCDGEDEDVSGGPCICNLNGKDECDIVTRLMVVLPETGTSLGWQLRSIGENASKELSGAIMIAEEIAQGRAFVPATLRLTQRRGLKDGQVVRYVVPVLDFDLAAAAAIAPGEGRLALPAGYKPLEQRAGVTVNEGLQAVAGEAAPRATNGRSSAPLGPGTDEFSDAPLPVDTGEAAAPPEKATAAQLKKLNVLVGTLRDAGRLATEDVYIACGRDAVASDDGVVHWSPLRDSLSKDDASRLIETLTEFEAGGSLGEPAVAVNGHATAGSPSEIPSLVDELLALAPSAEARDAFVAAIDKNRLAHPSDQDKHVAWLRRQITTARKNAEQAAA